MLPVRCECGWLITSNAAPKQPVFDVHVYHGLEQHSQSNAVSQLKETTLMWGFSIVGLHAGWNCMLSSHVPLSQVARLSERNVRVDLQILLAVLRMHPSSSHLCRAWLLAYLLEREEAGRGIDKGKQPCFSRQQPHPRTFLHQLPCPRSVCKAKLEHHEMVIAIY